MSWAERNFQNIFFLATGLLIFFWLAGSPLSSETALLLLTLGVIFLGLPHGALDWQIMKSFSHPYSRLSFAKYSFAYFSLVVAFATFWLNFPTLGLITFLGIAAFHFGDDWENRANVITRVAYGVTIMSLPARFYPEELLRIFGILVPAQNLVLPIELLLRALAALSIPAVMTIVASYFFYLRDKKRIQPRKALNYICIVAGAFFLNPIVFFTIYFCLLHSPTHLFDTARKLKFTSLQRVFRETAPVTLATVVLCVGGYFFMTRNTSTEFTVSHVIIEIIFIGLASLTLPHVVLGRISKLRH